MTRQRYSRRTLIKAAGIAPLVALASRAWSEPTEKNMELVRTATNDIPEAEVGKVVDAAVAAGLDRSKRRKFELVVRVLWKHFTVALQDIKVPQPSVFNLVDFAFRYKTGAAVIANIDEFDPLGRDYATNYCAYSVGYELAVVVESGQPFNDAHYKAAWDKVEKEMAAKLERARKGGEKPPNTGLGC